MEIRVARQEDRLVAVRVWHAANVARGVVPSPQRIDRVRQKLEAADAVVLLAWVEGDVRAMALAEPWRTADGAGVVVPGRGHLSMVFVDPDHQGQGLGSGLLAGLHEILQQHGWAHTSVWTRESNHRAQRLYIGSGYQQTGRASGLPTGERVLEFKRSRGTRPSLG